MKMNMKMIGIYHEQAKQTFYEAHLCFILFHYFSWHGKCEFFRLIMNSWLDDKYHSENFLNWYRISWNNQWIPWIKFLSTTISQFKYSLIVERFVLDSRKSSLIHLTSWIEHKFLNYFFSSIAIFFTILDISIHSCSINFHCSFSQNFNSFREFNHSSVKLHFSRNNFAVQIILQPNKHFLTHNNGNFYNFYFFALLWLWLFQWHTFMDFSFISNLI